jgi:hypothetical protein
MEPKRRPTACQLHGRPRGSEDTADQRSHEPTGGTDEGRREAEEGAEKATAEDAQAAPQRKAGGRKETRRLGPQLASNRRRAIGAAPGATTSQADRHGIRSPIWRRHARHTRLGLSRGRGCPRFYDCGARTSDRLDHARPCARRAGRQRPCPRSAGPAVRGTWFVAPAPGDGRADRREARSLRRCGSARRPCTCRWKDRSRPRRAAAARRLDRVTGTLAKYSGRARRRGRVAVDPRGATSRAVPEKGSDAAATTPTINGRTGSPSAGKRDDDTSSATSVSGTSTPPQGGTQSGGGSDPGDTSQVVDTVVSTADSAVSTATGAAGSASNTVTDTTNSAADTVKGVTDSAGSAVGGIHPP